MFRDLFFLEPNYFKENTQEIRRENRIQIQKLSLTGLSIAVLLLIASILFRPLRNNAFLYLLLAAFNVIVYLAANGLHEESKWIIRLFYLYYIGCFAFAIGLSLMNLPVASNVSFCVFLVVLPTFMIDRQWRIHCFLILTVGIHFLCCFFFAPQKFDVSFVTDCLAFLLIAISIHSYNLRLHIKNMESRLVLAKRVETDSLTQLYNRSALEKHIEAYITKQKDPAAFILLDVDNFKSINDNFGHTTGDEILCQTAAILKEQFRRSDFVGRLGGDEFVIFLPRVSDIEWLKDRMQCIVDDMDRTFIGDSAVCNVSSSIGIALFAKHGNTFEELYKNADTAMYESKKKGKNQYTIYDESMVSVAQQQNEM